MSMSTSESIGSVKVVMGNIVGFGVLWFRSWPMVVMDMYGPVTTVMVLVC